MPTESQEPVIIGKISAAHGIQGEVKIALYIDEADFLRERKSLFLEGRPRREVGLTRVRVAGGQLVVGLEGVTTRNDAEALRGREVSVPLAWLPPLEEDEFYVAQLIGIAVETAEGEPLGTLAEVVFTGANEVYVVRGGPRGEILFPAIASVVQSVDLEAGRMVVTLPEGLLD